MEQNTALQTQGAFELASVDTDTLAIIQEELDGLGEISFDAVKIPTGGSVMFELPGDDPDVPEMVPELVGVIVHHRAMNAYWKDAYAGGNTPPDCASMDGHTGTVAETGECRDCKTCPLNQFGSDADGRSKACKNMRRLYLLLAGEPLPLVFTIPPTGLKGFKNYLSKRVVLRGKRAHQVVTRITLKKEKNATGIAYSQPVFTKAGELTAEQVEALKPVMGLVESVEAQTVPITAAPVSFQEVQENEKNLPF